MSLPRLIFWILQWSSAACFIGHGAFGIITKKDWVRFFEIVGIQDDWAFRLMPWIGAMDIGLGLAVLLLPLPIFFVWMTVWAAWTALCRPLSGLSIWEFFERAGNYGVPFTMLVLCGISFTRIPWLTRLQYPTDIPAVLPKILRVTTALLLIGHGGFYVFVGKAALIQHWASIGVNLESHHLIYVGLIEYALAAAALVARSPFVFAGIVLWKVTNEMLYPLSGAPWWEFVERAGSYAAPLALYFILQQDRAKRAVKAI